CRLIGWYLVVLLQGSDYHNKRMSRVGRAYVGAAGCGGVAGRTRGTRGSDDAEHVNGADATVAKAERDSSAMRAHSEVSEIRLHHDASGLSGGDGGVGGHVHDPIAILADSR